ncbi:hypothetical protein QZH41_002191 [Actinostola sp. cb2023]|nr:hypothetical protein QZH41_002191 [Actinostola sp. cb2023]
MESIYLKVTRDYTPTDKEKRFGGQDSAITVEKGDIIFDVHKDDDGWMCGKNLNTGKSGRFPSDCVAKLSDEKDNSSPKTAERKDSSSATPPNRPRASVDTKSTEPKRTVEPTGDLRRPPNPRPFGLSSRFPKSYEREKKESSGDSGVVEDGEDYYLNDEPPEKKKPPDNRKTPSESETKKPSIYESKFGNKTYSPIYSTRPSVSKLKSAFLDNDLKATKTPDMKGKDTPKDNIEMAKKPTVNSEAKDKNTKIPKVALAAKEDDNDSMYASAEIDDKPSDVNKNKKSDTSKQVKDKKVNIQDNPLSKEGGPPYHSYQVPQAPDKPPRTGGCSECDEPHIYADPAADHYMEPNTAPETSSAKYDLDPTDNPQEKLLEKTTDNKPESANRRSYNRMASYESISNVGPKNASKARSTESIRKDAMKAVKKTKKKLTSPDKYPKIRIITGTLLGIFFGVFVFLLFFLVIPALHVVSAIVAGIVVGLVFAMIFGFLDRKRLLCIILLIFPSFFATRGKITLWVLILYFLVAGPLCNFIGNVHIIALSRGDCFVTSGSIVAGNTSDEAYPSYKRVVHPLLQRYIDTMGELKELVNTTITPQFNKTTLQVLCADLSVGLKNNCLSLANKEYQECMHDSKDPKILKRCQTLLPQMVCNSLQNIEDTCQNIDLTLTGKFVTVISDALKKAPSHAAVAAYRHEDGPILVSPARQKCDNCASILTMLLPLLILLVLYEAYSYHKLYLARNDFDNQYLTTHFKTIEDTRKASGANDGLLPLKKCEHQRYIQPTSPQFTISERNNMLKYLLVYVIFLAFVLFFILCDYYLYYTLTRESDTQEFSPKQSNNATNTTTTSNATVSAAVAGIACAPLVLPLEQYYVVVISVLLGLLLLMILFQPYVLRLRHYIASRLYRRRERKRIAYVYYKLLEERKAFYKAVIDNINTESEANYAMDQLDAVRVLAWNFQTMEKVFSVLGVSLRSCMVCGRGLNRHNPVTRSSSFIQGSSRKRKMDNSQSGIILAYDITRLETFHNIKKWLRYVDEHANNNVQKVLVGNKSDIDSERIVPKESGIKNGVSHRSNTDDIRSSAIFLDTKKEVLHENNCCNMT